jgi:hypothetical protein
MKIYLSSNGSNRFQACLVQDAYGDTVEICEKRDARDACLRAALVLQQMAERFRALADEERPCSDATHAKINRLYPTPEKARAEAPKAMVPVRNADGSLHELTLKVAGKPFRCQCGCNVFHQPDNTDAALVQCNACGNQFR